MGRDVFDYHTAFAYLEATNRLERKVANNTRIRMCNTGNIALKYHASDILVYCLDGTIQFDSCGFKTRTTKDRLNWFQNVISIHQHNFEWYVSSPKLTAARKEKILSTLCVVGEFKGKDDYVYGCVDFFDGMIVSREGEIINGTKET